MTKFIRNLKGCKANPLGDLSEGEVKFPENYSQANLSGKNAFFDTEIKKKYPHIKIIVAGPIAFKSFDILNNDKIHAVIKGEYEKNTLKVINGKNGLLEHDLLTVEEMNNAPFPYYDKLIYGTNTICIYSFVDSWNNRIKK